MESTSVVWQRQATGGEKVWITYFPERYTYFLYLESPYSNSGIGTSFASKEEAIRYANSLFNKGREPTRLRITRDGKAYTEWWNPEAKEILCQLCGREREACHDCTMMNPYCG